MTLIKCEECGNLISNKATSCPKCGTPVTNKIECSECKSLIPATSIICPECGAPLEHSTLCPECNTYISDSAKVCSHCGHQISDKAIPIPKYDYLVAPKIELDSKEDSHFQNLVQPPKAKKGKKWILIISFSILALLIISGYITWMYFDNKRIKITKELVEATYKYDDIREFHDGMAAVCKNGKWGYIDKQGKECIPCIYDYVVEDEFGGVPLRNFSEGLVAVCINEKWGFIDKGGNQTIPCECRSVEDFSGGLALVDGYDSDFYGYINKLT